MWIFHQWKEQSWRTIPYHMCHDTNGLKQYKIPLLILNSSKHPTRFYSGSFQTFYITILTFTAAGARQECVYKALCVSQWKETAMLLISVTSSKIMLSTKWPKRQYIICYQKRPANNTEPIFWTNANSEEIIPKKQCHMLHFFITCITICFSKCNMWHCFFGIISSEFALHPRKKSKPSTEV